MTKLLLFIPFFNCEKQLPRVLNSLLSAKVFFSHILLVDNRSTDKSVDVAKEWIENHSFINTTILQNHKNINLGGSHKVAFHYALQNNFTHLLVLHGDDQASIQDILPYLENLNELKDDCLLGSRFSSGSQLLGYSMFRTFGNRVLNLLCSFACKKKIEDMGAGLNLYNCSMFKDDRIWIFPNNLTFNVYLLFHSCFSSHKVRFFPISWREEDQISNAKVFKQFFIILKMILFTSLNKNNLYQKAIKEDYTYDVVFP